MSGRAARARRRDRRNAFWRAFFQWTVGKEKAWTKDFVTAHPQWRDLTVRHTFVLTSLMTWRIVDFGEAV